MWAWLLGLAGRDSRCWRALSLSCPLVWVKEMGRCGCSFACFPAAHTASATRSFVEPLAAGSGIPEVKTYLNGKHLYWGMGG